MYMFLCVVPFAGLDNYRTYTISVQAFNSAGISWKKASPDSPIQPLNPSSGMSMKDLVIIVCEKMMQSF